MNTGISPACAQDACLLASYLAETLFNQSLDCHRVGLDLPSAISRPVVLDQEPNISHLISLPEMRRKEGHQLLLLHGYLPAGTRHGREILRSIPDRLEKYIALKSGQNITCMM
jgi:hypothetical protein